MLNPWTEETLAPMLLALSVPFIALTLLGHRCAAARVIASVTCVISGLRYIWWRWAWSLPENQALWQQVWAWIFLTFETLSITSSIATYTYMSRCRNRSPEVDARAGSPLVNAAVDVFIATYNEDYDILERTIIGAASIDHADLRVWVLDDGARPWVRELAHELGALYCCRVKGQHAKAGNINEGLKQALATGRRPDFLLLLDADFVPARHILKRTLPLFEETGIGIVQTPQHFFNPDPIQSNLLCATTWPDEQRFFFNHLLESKDAWGVAFCCGTSAVIRVAALEQCGGMPTATVTEDMLTSFRMRELGYRTIFLNERLSLGLAPESLKEYVSQRARWCLGVMQQLRTRWSFAGSAPVGLANRISMLDAVLFWFATFAFKLMMISAPMIYWWTGTAVINSTMGDIVIWLGPFLVSGMVFVSLIAGGTVFPVMTDVTHLLAAPAIVGTVITGLMRPWGRPFKVTAKGVSTDRVTIQWHLLAPFAALGAATVVGMFINLSPRSPLYGTPGYALNMFWSVFNVAVLVISCFVCVELPKRRRDERFLSGEQAHVAMPVFAAPHACAILDISVGGARLVCDDGWGNNTGVGELAISGAAPPFRFQPVRIDANGALVIRFMHNAVTRRALARLLFTGGYDNEVERVSIPATLLHIARRVFQ